MPPIFTLIREFAVLLIFHYEIMPHPLERFGLLQPVTEQKDKGLSNESQIIIAEYWSGQLNTSNTEALYYNKYSV